LGRALFKSSVSRSQAALTCGIGKGETVIKVRCGPLYFTDVRGLDIQFVGKTIAQVRTEIEILGAVPASGSAIAFDSKDRPYLSVLDKTYPLSELYRLRDGDDISFPSVPGFKCPIMKCELCGRKHCFEHDGCISGNERE
jgi:hypothetical protein